MPRASWRASADKRPARLLKATVFLALLLSAQAAHAAQIGLWQQDSLTDGWGGLRDALASKGIIFGADSIDEIFGNVGGGVKAGAVYDGRLEVLATVELDRAIGWGGATFHANAFVTHGRGLSANYLGANLMTVSNIEATRSVRLFTCWIEQALFKGRLSVRAGQIAADDEFFVSQYAGNFINSTFGWPAIMAANLPSGGPGYPLAALGLRLNLAINDRLSVAAALFNGNPTEPSSNPEQKNPSGLGFRTGDDAFIIAEASYSVNQGKDAAGLPASYKIGVWSHSGRFPDRFGATGLSQLAIDAGARIPTPHRGDFGVYVMLDQFLWKLAEPGRGLAMFLRLAGAPSDRNLVSFYGDVGMVFQEPFPGRDDDVVGLGFAYGRIGEAARALETPISDDDEATIEATYRFQASPWWALQFDVQHVFNPRQSVASPASGLKPIADATIFGLRSSVFF